MRSSPALPPSARSGALPQLCAVLVSVAGVASSQGWPRRLRPVEREAVAPI